jgi:hypothetical protein
MINPRLNPAASVLCALALDVCNSPASPWAVTISPDKIGEPYDPPPNKAPQLNLPTGSTNLARRATLISSDPCPVIGNLEIITDGDRGAWETPPGEYWNEEEHILELLDGKQYIQLDLQQKTSIDAIWIWQRHMCEGFEAPCDVIVQISNDSQFESEVFTVFNCDHDNSMGFGIGQDRRYLTSRYGKFIPVNAVNGRYVRLWSNGSTWYNTLPGKAPNSWVEVEVYGRKDTKPNRPTTSTAIQTTTSLSPAMYGTAAALIVLAICWFLIRSRTGNHTA